MTYFGDVDDEQAAARSCELVSVVLRLLTSSFQHDCEAFLTNEVVSQLEQPLVDQVPHSTCTACLNGFDIYTIIIYTLHLLAAGKLCWRRRGLPDARG